MTGAFQSSGGDSHQSEEFLSRRLLRVGFFLTRTSIRRMLRDNTPVDSTKTKKSFARCPAYGEIRLKNDRLPRFLLFSILILVAGGSLRAQTTGAIRGTVADPTGAVVPGAQIAAILTQANSS